MSITFQTILILNALFFLFYGIQSLISKMMIAEFKRFGLTDSQRIITAILQILGAMGLLLSYFFVHIGLLAAMGFTVMMLVAFMVRIKIKDSVVESIPSMLFMVINAWLTLSFYNLLQ